MRCTSPRTVGFLSDGKTISWSQKNYSKEYATFQLPCGKCIECRLEYAKQWAVRCVHEAQMHKESIFLTLTYSDEFLESPKLIYEHFQLFMKKLRKTQNTPIGVFVTGEYGDRTKRPHWHACLFGYRPKDSIYKRSTERGDRIFESPQLTKIWGKGLAEFGEVTIESAGYCARYAAKKLNHGRDQDHDFHPISKKSSKHAIGKRWLEQHWEDAFNYGHIVLADGSTTSIPRYYEKWLKEHQPEAWLQYIQSAKQQRSEFAAKKHRKEQNEYIHNVYNRSVHKLHPITPLERRRALSVLRLKNLHQYLKL